LWKRTDEVSTLDDISAVPDAPPRPELPSLALVPALMVPPVSPAFIGLGPGSEDLGQLP